MTDSSVKEDYDKFHDVNMDAMQRTSVKGIIYSLLAVTIPTLALIHYGYIKTLFGMMIVEIFLSIILMAPIMWYFIGRSTTKMNMAHEGYDVTWQLERQKLFGWDTYHILRADSPGLQGHVSGYDMNPFSTSRRTIQRRTREQQENATCETCGRTIEFNPFNDTQSGGWFVEERKRLWLFGVPVRETIRNYDAYCSKHKPKESKYE